MSLDELTIKDLMRIASAFSGETAKENAATGEKSSGLNGLVGRECIVRTFSAGVWFGTISEKSGNEVILTSARRMWRWQAAKSISLSGVAVHGIDKSRSRIAPPVELVWLEAIEIIPVAGACAASIKDSPYAEAQ